MFNTISEYCKCADGRGIIAGFVIGMLLVCGVGFLILTEPSDTGNAVEQDTIKHQIVEHQIVEHQIVENQVNVPKQEIEHETEDKEVDCGKGSYCTECGAKLPEGAKFCGECGTAVNK